MKTLNPEQKARKRAERQNKRRELLRIEMRKDVLTLRKILHGTAAVIATAKKPS